MAKWPDLKFPPINLWSVFSFNKVKPMNVNKKAAEILVECGYAVDWGYGGNDVGIVIRNFNKAISSVDSVDPFADTLEGRLE